MSFETILKLAWRWSWLLLLGSLAGLLGGYVALRTLTPWPRYKAVTTILVDDLSAGDATELRRTYVALATRRPVTEQIVATLNLPIDAEELAEQITAELVGETQLIEISAIYNHPLMAARIADEAAAQLVQVSLGEIPAELNVVAAAQIPSRPEWGGYVALLVATVTGYCVAGGIVLLLDFWTDRLHTAEDVEERLDLPVLATVDLRNGRAVGLRMLLTNPGPHHNPSPADNDYQWLCFGIDQADGGGRRLLVTAPGKVNQQLSVVMGMANQWAEHEQRVILINAHSRPPIVSAWFGLRDEENAGEAGDVRVKKEILAPVEGERGEQEGALTAVASPILSGIGVQNLLMDDLVQEADRVLVNGTPVLSQPQSALVAGQVDAVVLVLIAGRTSAKDARAAMQVLRLAGGKILGAALVTA
jgi:capsular polysaccharide biosynthesis protein